MNNSFVNRNPLMNQYNEYSQRNTNIPFQNNNLIKNNIAISNKLYENIHRREAGNYNSNNNYVKPQKETREYVDIVKEMLKPMEHETDNTFIHENYKTKRQEYDNYTAGLEKIKLTNVPYKIIMKDNIVNKPVDKITEDDFVVHKVVNGIDNNLGQFNREHDELEEEMEKINNEIEMEYNFDNYVQHKKNFEYRETFIKNTSYKSNDFNENKQDYIEFFEKKQKELDDGIKYCDDILKILNDDNNVNDYIPKKNDD